MRVFLEAQHNHRGGVGRPRQTEAIRILYAQAVEFDDFVSVGEFSGLLEFVHQRVMLAFGVFRRRNIMRYPLPAFYPGT